MSHAALENQMEEGSTTRQATAPACLQSERTPGDADVDQCRPTGILVIDDERLMLKAMEQGLRKQGFAVWAAADGAEGVDLYRRFWAHIDVVLSDVQMPHLDGPRTLDALREINPFVRCCFMTGDTRLSTLTGLLKRGARRVFTKPLPSVAEVAEELWELATRPDEFSAGLELASEEAAQPGDAVSASRPAERPPARLFLGWVFSPLVRSVAAIKQLRERARARYPGDMPPT